MDMPGCLSFVAGGNMYNIATENYDFAVLEMYLPTQDSDGTNELG
jgi:hypothetical protein